MPINTPPTDINQAGGLAEAILATITQPLLVLDRDLRVVFANHAFYECFRETPAQTEGRFVYDLGNRQWDIPALRRLLEQILPAQKVFNHYEVVHDFQKLGERTMLLNARRVDHIEFILLAIEDVTERKRDERLLRESERRFRLVAAEVDHRAKNLLTLVQVIVRLTRAATVKDFVRTLGGRIDALARAHALLAANRWQSVDLARLVREELAPFKGDAARLRVAGPPCALSPTAAQSLGMAVHELATNAAKYGSLSSPQGSLAIDWTFEPGKPLVLRWQEIGGPSVDAPTERGMGTGLIERTVENQLGGELRFDWLPEGLACEITIPPEELVRGDTAS